MLLSTFSFHTGLGLCLLLLSVINAQDAPAVEQWELAGLGPGLESVGLKSYVQQKANLLQAAGDSVRAALNGSSTSSPDLPTSFVATSGSNKATLGQTDSNGLLVYTPSNSNAVDAADFTTFFMNAYANASIKGVAFTAGQYLVNNSMPSFHFNLYCFNRPAGVPFELSFKGVTMLFGNYNIGGMAFYFCQNLYFHGPFNFMYQAAALPFSQGTITALTNQGNGQALYTVQTDAGYPTTTTGLGDGNTHLCVAYDTNGNVVPNATDIYTSVPTATATPGLYTFSGSYLPTILVGHRLAIRGNAGNHGLFFYKNVNLRAQSLYVYTAPIFGILDVLSTNSTFSSNIIQPWPYTIGSTFPLLSTNADGIHVSNARLVGPSIVSNQVINSGDDAIAVHGNYYTTYSNDPPTKSVVLFSANCGNSFCQIIQIGDSVTLYSPPVASNGTVLPSAFTNLGTSVITNITLINLPAGDNSSPTNHPGYPFPGDTGSSVYPLVNYAVGWYYNVTFSTFPAGFAQATKDGLASDVTAGSNNFKVTSNYVTNHRARSIHVKASNGTIASNVVVNPTIMGLLLTPDLYFLESDFPQNVTISNNYVDAPFASLYQLALNPQDGSTIITQNFRNLSYTGNTFDLADTWSSAMSSTFNLSFKGNLIRNAGCYPFVYGNYNPQIPPKTLVYVAQTSNATLTGNSFYTNQNCNNLYGNYAAPFSLQNVTLTSK